MKKFRKVFNVITNDLQNSVTAAVETHLDTVRRTLDIIRSENAVSESEQDPEFRGRVGAKIGSAEDEIRQIQTAVGA
jgi:hypothetical protein